MTKAETIVRVVAPWRLGFDHPVEWENETEHIDLLTPDTWELLPEGTVVRSVMGDYAIKGDQAWTDSDTRGGFLAWGLPCEQEHPNGNTYYRNFKVYT